MTSNPTAPTELVDDARNPSAAAERRPTPGIEEFCAAAADLLGPGSVIRDAAAREKASCDWAHMSPILSAKLPAGHAEVVLRPTSHEQLPGIMALAHRHRIPLTPRGKGTGNYGQAIPLYDGAVLDLTGCGRVLDAGDGWIRAEAGAKMSDLEAHARTLGQELWMFPSTFGTTVGGFLSGGSGGTGSLVHRTNGDGFVRELTVVPCTVDAEPFTVRDTDALPYIHAYGTTGITATATVRLQRARTWTGLFAAFDDWASATAGLSALVRLEPAPRLVSLDEADLVRVYQVDPALDPTALNVRAIVEDDAVDAARAIVRAHGGRVLEVRPAPDGPALISSLSFNHPTYHLMKAEDGWFHLEIGGDVLLGNRDGDGDIAEIRKVFPGTLLHLEGMRSGTVGMLMARYEDEQTVHEGIAALEALGVGVHSPHNWYVDRRLDLVREAARTADPLGLLNPGKIPGKVPDTGPRQETP
ncbi:FAD-binding protein [Streptomyces sp. NBC_01352]|uniref:FAD-binding oxidoreductase n=1 Tax=unclassified Streptomyces TaxID=2593676 RepID=UPI0022566BB3|nr:MULTISPECIES: FAD-binding protein [unclassified Streptomyces]MCX4705157.1 FAD-binding protein [Streptomyces sp. NBC_01373]